MTEAGLDDLKYENLPVIDVEIFLSCFNGETVELTQEAKNECLKVV